MRSFRGVGRCSGQEADARDPGRLLGWASVLRAGQDPVPAGQTDGRREPGRGPVSPVPACARAEHRGGRMHTAQVGRTDCPLWEVSNPRASGRLDTRTQGQDPRGSFQEEPSLQGYRRPQPGTRPRVLQADRGVGAVVPPGLEVKCVQQMFRTCTRDRVARPCTQTRTRELGRRRVSRSGSCWRRASRPCPPVLVEGRVPALAVFPATAHMCVHSHGVKKSL